MAVALLGLLTAALSADALYRAISVTRTQRLERGREAVRDEIDRLAALEPAGISSTFSTVVGLRGGLATGANDGHPRGEGRGGGGDPIRDRRR